jgi:hypothetical protein
MKLSDRERLVVLWLPLALILGGYTWWFNLVQRPRINQVEKVYREIAAKPVSAAEVLTFQARVTQLTHELDALAQQKSRLQAEAAEITGRVVDPRKRILAEQQLSDLFRQHGLQVLEQGPAKQAGDLKLPKAVTDALGRFGEVNREKLGQVLCWRLAGRFADVRTAVQELARQEAPPGIAIGLIMAEADVTVSGRQWTLFVWM